MTAPRRNALTPEALQMMDIIARTGSFAAAAREMGRVPSALTYSVRQLEDALDVLLFDRKSRQAQLTAAGQELLDEGRRLLAEMDAVANEVRERNAKIKELEARRPDSGEDAPIPCGSVLHRGDNPPIQPMERNAVNHKTLEVVLHKEGAKKGKVKVLGDFTVVPAEDGGLAKVFHCDVCRAKLNAAARKNNLRQPWYNSMGAERVLYFEEHRAEFEARGADKLDDDLAERMVLGGIAKPFRASIGERVGGGQRRQR